jgi:shikimate dehydrogenase
VQNGNLYGENTDWSGFLQDLIKQFPSTGAAMSKKALILGAGGSARAVVYALAQSGWQINIFTRRFEQAQQLAEDFSVINASVNVLPTLPSNELAETTLIVNTTPSGMFPNTLDTPWPPDLSFPRQAFLYDLIYNPSDTVLMKTARSEGIQAANGLGMLVEQAALAFEIWTGQSVSRQVFQQAAIERNLS